MRCRPKDLVAEFESTRNQWNQLGQALAALTERLAIETVAEALPGTAVIESCAASSTRTGSASCVSERVLSATGGVLFDVADGHDDRRVEEAIDEVNYEYLDSCST